MRGGAQTDAGHAAFPCSLNDRSAGGLLALLAR